MKCSRVVPAPATPIRIITRVAHTQAFECPHAYMVRMVVRMAGRAIARLVMPLKMLFRELVAAMARPAQAFRIAALPESMPIGLIAAEDEFRPVEFRIQAFPHQTILVRAVGLVTIGAA